MSSGEASRNRPKFLGVLLYFLEHSRKFFIGLLYLLIS